MNAKHYILGLDMGTNSIGWAAIDAETQQIIATGSRIIPMDERSITDFDKGVLQSSPLSAPFTIGCASPTNELNNAVNVYSAF